MLAIRFAKKRIVLNLNNCTKSALANQSFRPSSTSKGNPVNTISAAQAIADVTKKLEAGGVPEPGGSALQLVAGALGMRPSVEKHAILTAEAVAVLETMVQCRLSRMPVQYILKEWDFRELSGLRMRPPVFIPRPETEELVGLVLQEVKQLNQEKVRVMEIGCGSGAVSLSLLKEGSDFGVAEVAAIDQSKAACALTLENAFLMGLEHRLSIANAKVDPDGTMLMLNEEKGNASAPLNFDLDVVVANPPYVPRKDLMRLPPEISLYEDLRALDGGKEGLDVIIPIIRFCSSRLIHGGRLFMEYDPCHRLLLPAVLEREAVDMAISSFHKDFANKDRFVCLRRK